MDSMPDAPAPPGQGRLWLVPGPRPVPDGDTAVVLDAAWTPAPGSDGRTVTVRDAMDRVLRRLDPLEETSRLLDAWAEASDVIDAMTIGETSFWYYVRLRHWRWLQERVVWAAVLRQLLEDHRPAELVSVVPDGPLAEIARLMAAAAGLAFEDRATSSEPVPAATAAPKPARESPPASGARSGRASGLLSRVIGALRPGTDAPANPERREPKRAAGPGDDIIDRRVEQLAAEPERRLLVVLTHAMQRIDTPSGTRVMNPYIGPVADQLHGTSLEPIYLDWRARRSDPEAMARITGPGTDRVLPSDAIRVPARPEDREMEARLRVAAAGIAEHRIPVITSGVDLGPALAARVAEDAARWLPRMPFTISRLQALFERLHVRALLVADEYHRQDCMEAARRAGIPVVAIQHGTIYRRHTGYIHQTRPPTLSLPARTYVFGAWERELLLASSVYRDDEVVVGGSPRLDLFVPAASDPTGVRAELGVAPTDRLLVLSGTYGEIYRAFHYPVVLARLFDAPMPGVHLVVKQHPAEADEGPYRRVIEGIARSRGFDPLRLTIVKDVDLYRLLTAADAHLGVHSTVLTEAVFVGTPNLLAVGVLGGDLLGYVDAGVAVPVERGTDVLAALGRRSDGPASVDARSAFIRSHFEPGSASERIAKDLVDWLA